MKWQTISRTITFEHPLIMGIVNVTPDSFSDGGRWFDETVAVQHALRLIDDGADIIDIGGESTRPGATPVTENEELQRVRPTIERLAKQVSVPISVDTMKPAVARACVDVGAEIINDVSGLRDPAMIEVVKTTRAAVVVMHMKGTPQTMQEDPRYDDVVTEVGQYFDERTRSLYQAGIEIDCLCLDPGIGFGKQSIHNWKLLAGLKQYRRFDRPMCLGVSRKRFLGKNREPQQRVTAGIAVACHGVVNGSVQIVRTHDVAATRDALSTLKAIVDHE